MGCYVIFFGFFGILEKRLFLGVLMVVEGFGLNF